MDGIATIITGLVLVIALNIVFANSSEHRRSEVDLLNADVRDVIKAVQNLHGFILEIREPGAGRDLLPDTQKKLGALILEYSNSLNLVEYSLSLCGLETDIAFQNCRHDRERYKDLITGGAYPVSIDPAVFIAEQGEYATIQKHLRAMMFRIGHR